ncbi:hypothetical protein B0T22DRAFT_489093 [Podospora appendiculata]|uniref:Nephrocystin 3-like N-terminal domain-containing protein n=1 Tax=Podospora appendiculata TaxID=314037 RepID=A0AAE0XM82_9PEZI|nr:hypothetical protein B0T22DRAFT_489093 [Podospora appendiculata]
MKRLLPRQKAGDIDAAENHRKKLRLSNDRDRYEQPGTASQHGDGNRQFNNFGTGPQKNVEGNYFEAEDDQYFVCLVALRVTTNLCHDKKRIEMEQGGLLKDSYRWVLSNVQFQQWRDGEDNRLLWIKGDPGKGKTMLPTHASTTPPQCYTA